MASVLWFLTAAFICSTSVPQRAARVELQTQVKSHSGYFSQGSYDLMWEMSSKRFRDSNDNNKEKYVSDLQKYRIGRVRAKILDIRTVGEQAKVTVRLSVWSNQDRKWLREVIQQQWVCEAGHWVFDRQLPSIRYSRTNNSESAA